MRFTPTRIVCLQPSATVILASLGQLGRVVACTKHCVAVCPGVRQLPTVSDSWTARAEEIARLTPDLVIAAVPYQEKAVSEILKAGVRFVGLAPKTLADIYMDIMTIAGVADAVIEGERLVTRMSQRIDSIRLRTQGARRPKVFCEEWGKPIIASQPWVAELVDAAGGIFVGTSGGRLEAQDVAAANPDVLIAAWCGAADRVPLEKIIHDRGWTELQAVCNRRVYCINDELLNTPAPTLLAGLDALAFAIHPDLFPAVAEVRQIRKSALTPCSPAAPSH